MDIKVISLLSHDDERGRLTEIFRATDDEFGFGQIYITSCASGAIKAWHKHTHQVDRWYCVSGTAKVGLYNKDTNESKCVILSEEKPQLLVIPHGIYHGFTPCWGSSMASILNIPSRPYNNQNPDEQRIGPFDLPFNWSIESK
jgi:dTDP-4-dehydrorhamnose 3,5-epimerase-like enzyme